MEILADPNPWLVAIFGGIVTHYVIVLYHRLDRFLLAKRRLASEQNQEKFPPGYHQRYWSFIDHFPRAKATFIASGFKWNKLSEEHEAICVACDALARLPEVRES